jgi:hypothetical protein
MVLTVQMMASPARVISSLVKATKDTSPRVIKVCKIINETF